MFISFEGIDGSGKSTQLQLLRARLEEAGRTVISVREPGATMLSESIRDILLSNRQTITPTAELLLFSAARTQLVENIIQPALSAGTIVLCDRYVDSTTAYQGYGRGLEMDEVKTCNRLATKGVMPLLTFFIDVAYDEAQLRMHFNASSGEPDRMERAGRDFFDRVRAGYLAIASGDPQRFVVLDGSGDRETIHSEIVRTLQHRCGIIL
ncbi:MAG TPA: dTMP kinase [Bacteroidetes bacterium]|nr:dTMP kinase [Bacteroidota bacterium]HRK04899.1 dTMP kinase [Chlorobiota bacterium]